MIAEIEDLAGGGLHTANPAIGPEAPERDEGIAEHACCLWLLIPSIKGNAMRGRNGLMKVSQAWQGHAHDAALLAQHHHRTGGSEINPIFEYTS